MRTLQKILCVFCLLCVPCVLAESPNRDRNSVPTFSSAADSMIASFDQQNSSYTYYHGFSTAGSSSFDRWRLSAGNVGNLAYATGVVHGCAAFAPGDPYVYTASDFVFSGDYTVCCWIKCTGTEENTELFKDGNNMGADGMAVYLVCGSGEGVLWVVHGATSFKSEEPILTMNAWTHVAITYASGNLRLYRDGVNVDGGSLTAPTDPATNSAAIMRNGTPLSTMTVYLDNFEVHDGVALSENAIRNRAFLE